MNSYVVYVTAKDAAEAKTIAQTVVEERLAACANIFADIQSVYRWEGKLCEDAETALVLKTTEARKAALIDRVKELHSYVVPCIVCLPIADGNPAFLDWIAVETA
ncbi:divalent-cation tolerance protein CutA [Pontiella sp.]|uniref:divalent-cation tolerance protein CutA n=1 Tax=Pontiella sp. TaxID=2837462 RepID=UPI0035650278